MTAIEATAIKAQAIPRQPVSARFWRAVMPYVLILPTFAFIFAFTLWPAGSAVVQSLYKPGVTAKIPTKFVGLGNYADLFDPSREVGQAFPLILGNTILYVAVTVGVSIMIALVQCIQPDPPMHDV